MNKYCPIFVVMQNHFRCIIAIQRDVETRADMESTGGYGIRPYGTIYILWVDYIEKF